MSVAIGPALAAGVPSAHSRQPNFGSLVSAIRRGDLDAAKGAFDALAELAPKTAGWNRKGPLDALAEALKASDLEAARSALHAYQQARLGKTSEDAPATVSRFAPGSTITIFA